MPKRQLGRNAFTLIEVMVAVMIVSVVIAALLQMKGNTNHKFIQLKKIVTENQYNTFLISVDDKYSFETSNTDLYRLVDNFDLENDLRRKLKSIKTKVSYEKLDVYDSGDLSDDSEENEEGEEGENGGIDIIFEIGKTSLKSEEFSLSLMRVKIQ
jgi:prepilin-type N-terminal cleavage/methylation domain-containing protein